MKKALLSALPSVEPLEARIAPATLTFVDVDGDQVTITTSKGTDADLAAAVTPFLVDDGVGKLLQKIDLSANPVFKGTNITITAEVGGSGDGLVNIGYINATGLDLGRVTVDGDLGQIDAGDSKVSTPGIKSLTVGSLGALGTTTQAPNGASLFSNIQGALSSLIVSGDIGGKLDVTGGAKPSAGRIGSIDVGGSLIGGDEQFTGSIVASGVIGSISIEGLQGGSAANTGYIEAASINSLIVEKSITGGSGEYSGAIKIRGDLKKVEIGENIVGGVGVDAHHSGEIRANGTIKNVYVAGQVQGGDGTNSGAVTSGQGLGIVQVDGGLTGGSGFESGTIGTRGTIKEITIGTGLSGGSGDRSGGVLATAKIFNVTINGDIVGGDGDNSGVVATDGGLETVTVNGSVKGGAGRESGAIGSTKTLTSVHITGNLEGGTGVRSGVVVSSTSIEKAIIDGSVIGGSNHESGSIGASGPVKFVKIGGDLQGGCDFHAGAILSGNSLGRIEIDGSVLAGNGDDTGVIFTRGTIASITIGNNLQGGEWYKSGLIEASRVGNVRIGGDVVGGQGWFSGSILATDFRSSEVPRGAIVSGPAGLEPLLGTISVRGNVYGGDGEYSGSFISEGQIKSVTIGLPGIIPQGEFPPQFRGEVPPFFEGNEPYPPFQGGSLYGGSAYGSGSIAALGNIGTVTIHGSVNGGFRYGEAVPYNSGGIFSGGDIQKIFIGRDLMGGSADYRDYSEGPSLEGPGQIYARGRIGDVDIRGSVVGSYGENSATIRAGAIGSIKVAESVIAGPGSYSASFIAEQTDIKSIKIGDQLTTYTNTYGYAGYHAASISAARNLGKVEIGTILGHTESRVLITAGGQIGARTDAQALSIGSLTVRNSTSYADILAGYDLDIFPVNPDAQIGTVTVGNSRSGEPSFAWAYTNVVAGSFAGYDGIFGTQDDTLIPESEASSSRVISKIARVIINGYIDNSSEGESIQQGIVAAQVVSVTLMGDKAPLKAGPRNDISVTFPFAPMLGINEPTTAILPV